MFITSGNVDERFEAFVSRKPFGNTIKVGLKVLKPLNREVQDRYMLNITATDGVHTSTSSVDVIIDDVNDNIPSFTKVILFLLAIRILFSDCSISLMIYIRTIFLLCLKNEKSEL